jgi:CBS domain-containing protein
MKEAHVKVRDVMTSQPKNASPGTTLAAAAHLLSGADCGILPVIEGGKFVGVVLRFAPAGPRRPRVQGDLPSRRAAGCIAGARRSCGGWAEDEASLGRPSSS